VGSKKKLKIFRRSWKGEGKEVGEDRAAGRWYGNRCGFASWKKGKSRGLRGGSGRSVAGKGGEKKSRRRRLSITSKEGGLIPRRKEEGGKELFVVITRNRAWRLVSRAAVAACSRKKEEKPVRPP